MLQSMSVSTAPPFSKIYELNVSRRFGDVLEVLQHACATVPVASFRQYEVMHFNLSLDPG